MHDDLKKYPVITTNKVMWGQMDVANHVNNTLYFRWAEDSRIAYFQAAKMSIAFKGGEIGPILGWQDCKYIFPLTFPDNVFTGTRLKEIKKDRIMLETAIYSEKHNRIAALLLQSIIPYNYGALEKAAIPPEWINAINTLESSTK